MTRAYGDSAASASPTFPERKKKRKEPETAAELVSRLTSFAVHDTASRVGAFSREFVHEHPHVAAHITFSPTETDKVQHLARGVSDAWGVAKTLTSFAGSVGALIQPIISAVRDPDPQTGKRKLRTITALRSLSPEEQATLDAQARASFLGVGTIEPTLPGVSEQEAQSIRAKVAKEMGTTIEEVDSHLWDAYYAPMFGIPGTSLHSAQGSGYLSALVGLGAPVGGTLLAYQFPIATGLLSSLPPALRAGGAALEHLPGGHVAREIISKPIWAISELGRGIAYPGAFAARKAMDAFGMSPSDPHYADIEAIGGFLGGWMIAGAAGRSGAAIKAARAAPRELVTGEPSTGFVGGLKNRGAFQEPGIISGRVAGAFYEVFSKPVEEWLRTRPGKRLARKIVETTDPANFDKLEGQIRSGISALDQLLPNATEATRLVFNAEKISLHKQLKALGKDPSGLLLERFKNMPPAFAEAVKDARTPDEVSLAFEDYIKRLDPKMRDAARTRVSEIDTALGRDATTAETATTLKIEKARLARQLSFEGAEPVFEVPTSSAIRRIKTATPTSKLGQKLSLFYEGKPLSPTPHPSRLFDDMGENVIYNPRASGAPADALSHNAEVTIRVGRRLGIAEPEIRSLLSRLAKGMDDPELFQAYVLDFAKSIRGSKAVAVDMRDRLAQRFEREVYERKKGVISHETQNGITEEDVIRYGKSPQPSLSSMFVNHITLPSLSEMIEGTSWIRSKLRPLEEARYAAKQAGEHAPLKTLAVLPYKALKSLSSWATAVFKPGVLALRIPALLLRIEGEEVARARMLGAPSRPFGKGLLHPIRGPLERGELDPEFAKMLGSISESVFEPIPSRPVWRSIDTVEWSPTGMQPPVEAWDGLVEQLAHWYTSPEGVELARRGVDGFLNWIDTPSGKYWAKLHQATLDKAGMDWRTWATRNTQWLDQLTANNPALKEAIATGRWRLGEASDVAARRRSKLGEDVMAEHDRLRQEDALYDDLIHEAYASDDNVSLRAFQDEQQAIRDRLAQIDREGGVRTRQSVEFDERDKFKAELQTAWQNGDYQFPPRLVVSERKDMMDRYMEADLVRRKVQNSLYRPLRSVGRSDIKRVRGGMFKTIYEKEYARLKGLGHEDAYANRFAQIRAARQTSEAMYDLAARSSAQQFLRNIFWFAPAWQEVLTTWAVKIPSRFYWPVGAGMLAGKTGLLLNVTKDLGLVTTDENGNLQTIIPGGNAFFDKFAHTKVAEIISFDPGRLNLVLGGWPGLSTQYNVAVGALAKKFGGVFGDISNTLQYLGPEATVLPQPLGDVWTAATGKAPPWEYFSRDYLSQVNDLAYDAALQDAYAQVGAAPSLPRETTKMSEAQRQKAEQAYQDRWKKWAKEMFATADRIQRGHSLVRLLGHTIFPTSLRVDSTERRAWNDFFANKVLGGKDLSGTFSQDQLNLMDSYVSEHPDSVAYRTFRTVTGEKFRNLPYTPVDENALWSQVYTGERRVLSRDEWVQKLSYVESYRFASGQLQQILADAAGVSVEQLQSATGVNAARISARLLGNGFERQGALSDYHDRQRLYEHLHHEYIGAVQDAKASLVRQYKAEGLSFPIQSFVAEKLGDLKDLLQGVSKLFLLDGHMSKDFRSVRSQVGQLFSEQANFGTPFTEVGKATAWYYDKVMTPYWDRVTPLYDKARRLSEAGETPKAGLVYDRIREVNNAFAARTLAHGGAKYPPPEQVMYGNLSDTDKETARLKWASEPITWLSDYQRKIVGYKTPKNWDRFTKFAARYDTQVQKIIKDRDLSTSSNAYQSLIAERDREIADTAKRVGVEKFWQMNEQPPYVRVLQHYAAARDNPAFQDAVKHAEMVQHAIDTAPDGSKGDTEKAWKLWFYGGLEKLTDPHGRYYDQGFADVMKDLSFAFAPSDQVRRTHGLLYSALFFDEWNKSFIDPELLDLGKVR